MAFPSDGVFNSWLDVILEDMLLQGIMLHMVKTRWKEGLLLVMDALQLSSMPLPLRNEALSPVTDCVKFF